MSGGRFGSTLVSQLLIDKYDDGLPLHRRKQRFERMGLAVAASTLADQVTWVTELLGALWRAAIRQVLAATVLHVDGTSLPVLWRDKETHNEIGSGKRLGTLWGYVGGETALYMYCSTGHKKGQTPADIGPEECPGWFPTLRMARSALTGARPKRWRDSTATKSAMKRPSTICRQR